MAYGKLDYLKRELEPLHREVLDRMAAGDFRDGDERLVFFEASSGDLIDDMAASAFPRAAAARIAARDTGEP